MSTTSLNPVTIVTAPIRPPDPDLPMVTDRQELVPGFHQAALSSASGILIGAGGINSEVGEGLARKGMGYLKIFDHDRVEHTNLNRQHYFECDVGKPKGTQLAINLAAHATCGTVFEGFPLSLEDALASKVDLHATVAVVGVDNGAARVAASQHFRMLGMPVIFIAVDLVAESGYVFVQEPDGPCFGCLFPRTMHGQPAPCRTPAVKDILKLVAGLALYAIDSLLMERKRNWNYRLVHLAGFAPDIQMTIPRFPGCPLCGDHANPDVALHPLL